MRQLKITKSITNRDDASLEKYLNDISKEELISTDEEINLARRIRNGDAEALQKMIKANLRFVVSVAKQYQGNGLPLVDLINEGNVGLIRAANKFDETRGFKFISYAVWWVRQSIMDALSEKSRIIRMPLNQVGTLTKINRSFSSLEQKLGRTPTEEEIAEDLDMCEIKVKESLIKSRKHISYDAPMGGDDDKSPLVEIISNRDDIYLADHSQMINSLSIDIERALMVLDDKTRDIIKLNYGIGKSYPISLDEIAYKYSISKERARQIREKGIRKLRHLNTKKILKTYI